VEEDKRTNLDQLIDDFNKKTAEQFKDIFAAINTINSELKDSLKQKGVINCM
jgi:hypothetical protein